jgi:glycosyltransferase involved in cell wall biosynthesis
MRVVIVSKTFVADTAQRQLEWIARQPNVELTLITPTAWHSDDGRVLPFAPRFTEGYGIKQLPVLFNGHYHFYLYRGLRPALRSLAPDIVHIDEEPYNPAGAQAQRGADAVGARTVFVAWQNLYRAYPFPFARLEQFDYQRTAHIIAGNAAAGQVVRRKGYAGPLSTFSVHGVDPAIYRPLPRIPDGDAFVIGYIGRLVLYKGVGLLVEALQGLPEHCRLRLIGSGPDEATLRQQAEQMGVAARVEFLPAVPTTQVPAALAKLDVMALPSLTQPNWMEQFGRTIIEAMACEVAVIGSDSGEIPNVVGDAGLIMPEGDASALRDGLLKLSTHPELRQMYASRGRARVLEQFTQEQVARKIAAVYQQVMSPPALVAQ